MGLILSFVAVFINTNGLWGLLPVCISMAWLSFDSLDDFIS